MAWPTQQITLSELFQNGLPRPIEIFAGQHEQLSRRVSMIEGEIFLRFTPQALTARHSYQFSASFSPTITHINCHINWHDSYVIRADHLGFEPRHIRINSPVPLPLRLVAKEK